MKDCHTYRSAVMTMSRMYVYSFHISKDTHYDLRLIFGEEQQDSHAVRIRTHMDDVEEQHRMPIRTIGRRSCFTAILATRRSFPCMVS